MRRLRDRLDSIRYCWRLAPYRGYGRVRQTAFALSGGVVPIFQSGDPEPTMTTTAAVTAGRLVMVSGNRSIAPAAAASRAICGVAKQTGSAVGDKLAVISGGVVMIVAQGAVAAGDQVGPGAAGDGRVSTVAAGATADVARSIVGLALSAAADGAECPVLLRLA